mmetsp:Transcript_39534/g.47524  ORF Transcript_39534/g.47524 Transcript_39534/m.47524 type:complete len:621 (-) Transcript_39534:135-1997(-)
MGNQASINSTGVGEQRQRDDENTTGRHQSSSSSLPHSLSFRRSTGSLGLSRTELDKRCKPSGLYPSCSWDSKTIRRLIGDGKLASRSRGTDSRSLPQNMECPICFLFYSQINMTKCCSAGICSECYLQIQSPGGKSSMNKSISSQEEEGLCPFCNKGPLEVCLKQKELSEKEDKGEQRSIENKIKVQAKEEMNELKLIANTTNSHSTTTSTSDSNENSENNNDSPLILKNSNFGKSLERQKSSRRERLLSMDSSTSDTASEGISSTFSSDSTDSGGLPVNNVLLASVEERKTLEQDINAQHMHPIALQMAEEAEQRRTANTIAHASSRVRLMQQRTNSERLLGRRMVPFSDAGSRLRRSFGGRQMMREWSSLTNAFDTDNDVGNMNSMDDMVVIEAAILLSMEEAARRAAGETNDASSGVENESESTEEGTREGVGSSIRQSILSIRRDIQNQNRSNADSNESNEVITPSSDEGPPSRIWRRDRPSMFSSIASSMRGNESGENAGTGIARDTARLLLRGLGEEEQLSLAIAMSLRDTSTSNDDSENTDNATEEEVRSVEGSENSLVANATMRSLGATHANGNESEDPMIVSPSEELTDIISLMDNITTNEISSGAGTSEE